MWGLLTDVSPGAGPALVGGGVTWDTVHVSVAGVIPARIRVAAYLKTNLNPSKIFYIIRLKVFGFRKTKMMKISQKCVCFAKFLDFAKMVINQNSFFKIFLTSNVEKISHILIGKHTVKSR
jgi:hypothetical protein